jgi:hypothetical protein
MLGAQAEGVQAEVLGNPTFSLRPKSLQPEPLQPIYLHSYVTCSAAYPLPAESRRVS